MFKFNSDSDLNWYAVYFLVPFFVIRIYMEFKGMAFVDPLMSTFWAAMMALAIGPPVYFLLRKQLEIIKLIPFVFYIAIGLLVSFFY